VKNGKAVNKTRSIIQCIFVKVVIIKETANVKPKPKSMKKTILMFTAIAFASATVFAQDLTSKKGEPYLPESGDWAISFDATPFLTYAGNLLNGNANNPSPGAMYVQNYPWAITGKMFKDEKTAYRAMLRIGFGSTTYNNYVTKDQATPDPKVTVSDALKMSANNILLGGGLEMRRGKTRLQGYYGGMAWIMLGGGKSEYTYGNAIDATFTSPTSTDWTIPSAPTVGNPPSRLTSTKQGSTFGLGIRGFIGAEYFIFPKISIGAEYGWGIGFMSQGEGESTTEYWDAVGAKVDKMTVVTGKTSMFGVDTDITNNMLGMGSLNITFHF
jgi:hypothetical protein